MAAMHLYRKIAEILRIESVRRFCFTSAATNHSPVLVAIPFQEIRQIESGEYKITVLRSVEGFTCRIRRQDGQMIYHNGNTLVAIGMPSYQSEAEAVEAAQYILKRREKAAAKGNPK